MMSASGGSGGNDVPPCPGSFEDNISISATT
jgi:hypothetical protein